MPTGPTGRATRAHRRTSPAARRLQNAYPIPQGQRFLSGSKLWSQVTGGQTSILRRCSLRDCSSSKCVATIFAAQIQEAIDVPFPGPLLGVLDQRESLRTTSHAKDGSPSLSGTAFFDLVWTMVRFARR